MLYIRKRVRNNAEYSHVTYQANNLLSLCIVENYEHWTIEFVVSSGH